MKRDLPTNHTTITQRRGSTLVIVIAMLGLLSLMGTMFYVFAIQERSTAEYFSQAAKNENVDLVDPFPWGLQQLIIGPYAYQKFSILADATGANRHSIVRNLVGPDVTPYTGPGVRVAYNAFGLPIADADYDLTADVPGSGNVDNLLNFVDSIAAWGSTGVTETSLAEARDYSGINALPHPDVDYTSPDINNAFLAYRGWAVRDNGVAATPRFERVQVIIPSFFRPQYLKSSTANDSTFLIDVPTDSDWYNPVAHPEYQQRSFRPHQNHVGGYDADGYPVFRFLEYTRDLAVLPTAGEFPFGPDEGNDNYRHTNNFGKLGVWTGDVTESPAGFELDSDNDGDGIKEGIWLDLQYPIQETTDGRFYATLHSFTIYDLDALLDLNAVGNLAQLPRNADLTTLVGPAGLGAVPVSDSNLGLGPNEINPIYALLPDEVDPDPDVNQRFRDWYLADPDPLTNPLQAPSNPLEQANMEWIWLLTGRMNHNGQKWSKLHPGKYGEPNATVYHKVEAGSSTSSLPRAGDSGDLTQATTGTPSFGGKQGYDDNLDSFEGIASGLTGVLRGFVHPMDYAGTGTNRLPADFRLPAMLQNIAGRPEAWLLYSGYSAVGSAANTLNDSLYMRGRNLTFGDADDLSIGHFFDALFEDPLEMILDLDFALRPEDQMFSVQDMLIGHLTDTDAKKAQGGLSKRLRNLMPMTYVATPDPRNERRSDRFTTLTHSFRHVPFLQQPGGPRSWEWTADADGDGVPEFPPRFGGVLAYSDTEDQNGNGTLDPGEDLNGNGKLDGQDPFRPEVRRLLTVEAGEQRENFGQLLLSVNHILDVNRSTNAPADDNTSEYLAHMQQFGFQFRALVEHSDDTAAATVTSMPTTQPAFPPQTFAATEYWARRDRQQLARDIYVLLYTLGGAQVGPPHGIINYTGDNSGRVLYTEQRLRQMAQFAVNMVDAMDTDNVVTRFEFDKDLGNGWGLDDRPWTATDVAAVEPTSADVTDNGLYPADTGNRGVVFGVEAQQLAFSEVLAVHSPDFSLSVPVLADDDATVYNDTDGDRHFLHVELQNMLPMPLDLASTATGTGNEDQGVWRLSRFDRIGAFDDVQTPIPDQTLTLMAGNGTLVGGDRFTIAIAGLDGAPAAVDPSGFGTADFYVDAAVPPDGNFHLVSPDVPSGTIISGATPQPQTRLDLIHTTHDSRWLLSGNSTDRGQFLNDMQFYKGNDDFGITAVPGATGDRKGFDLVLQRRQNPNLPRLSVADNPWIEVDRIKAEFIELYILGASATLNLENVTSLERKEPLDASDGSTRPFETTGTDPSPDLYRKNTIGSDLNSETNDGTAVFELWQAHFDRHFASAGELLNLPIVGPNLLTRGLDRMRYAGFQQAHIVPTAPLGVPDPDLVTGAAGMILQPELPGALPADNNTWYRLMQFVEVPSRVNRMLGNYVNLMRLPGKLNLNTIRHREVYAGLIDDLLIANVPPLLDPDGNGRRNGPFLISTAPDGTDSTPGLGVVRDRWLEFINERDGYVNTVNGLTETAAQMWLPATPNSRPFRSLAYTTGVVGAPASVTDTGLDHTILRRGSLHRPSHIANNVSLPVDNAFGETTDDITTNRHWLEPGNTTFHQAPEGVSRSANMVHRHQFLSKIMNNTTTTSNCFIVYGTAAYFEAVLDPSGVFRIGGRMGLDLDDDGDETEDTGWEQRGVFIIDRTETFNAFDSTSGEFEWERFVKHRLSLVADSE